MKKRRKASTSSKRDVSSSLCSMLSSSASNSAREKEPRAPTSALLAAAFTSSRVRVTPSLRKARTTSSSSKLCELSRSMEVKSFATLPACLLAIASCIAFAALWCRRLSTSFLSLCTPTSEPCGRRWGWTWSTAELQGERAESRLPPLLRQLQHMLVLDALHAHSRRHDELDHLSLQQEPNARELIARALLDCVTGGVLEDLCKAVEGQVVERGEVKQEGELEAVVAEAGGGRLGQELLDLQHRILRVVSQVVEN
eukprot:766162-Hanusia_phi.AAC.2